MATCRECHEPAQRLAATFRQGRRVETCPACAVAWLAREAARITSDFTTPALAAAGLTGNGSGGYRQPSTGA